ncbi:putative peptidase C1-like protein [Armadillidium nasatum]|uniref:Putative peptidase C1-like protein n=1 Tax=Armadillidium nasatum TaxID=96803 RepID=A0A5N5TK43_9CRUS|nr:putative peptidase C1-like protein [Armadillidium nasatum]
MLTGTLPPDEKSLRMHPIKLHYDEEQLPREFDARSKWDHISKIRDQGWCGASWAFSTLSIAQDRLAIASDGKEVVELSPQNLLSCNRRGQQACNGGHVERAWNYLRKIGVVPEDAIPTQVATQFPMNRKELYTTEPAYRIASKEGDIMWELMTNGPVQGKFIFKII